MRSSRSLVRAAMVGLVVASSLTACSKTAPTPGKVVTTADLCSQPDGSRVRMTGWIRYRRSMLSFCSTNGGHTTCDLSLYETAAPPADWNAMNGAKGPEPASASLSVPVGSSPGQMNELPEKFESSDVKIHLPQDGIAPEGSKVTVDGTVSVIPGQNPPSCFMNVDWAVSAT